MPSCATLEKGGDNLYEEGGIILQDKRLIPRETVLGIPRGTALLRFRLGEVGD